MESESTGTPLGLESNGVLSRTQIFKFLFSCLVVMEAIHQQHRDTVKSTWIYNQYAERSLVF